MEYYKKVKITFLSYFKQSLYNASVDYKRKQIKSKSNETSLDDSFDFKSLSRSCDDDFLFLSDSLVTYDKLEKLFSNKKCYQSMKTLNERQKQVLYLTVVKQLPTEIVSTMTGLTKDNIRKTKERAIKTFIKNYENLKGV